MFVEKGQGQQQPQQGQQVRIKLSDLDDVVCESCGNNTFIQCMQLKKVSALVSPTGEEGLYPVPVFSCVKCDHVNSDFLPKQIEDV